MKRSSAFAIVLSLCLTGLSFGQEPTAATTPAPAAATPVGDATSQDPFRTTAESLLRESDRALEQLNQLREEIDAVRGPMNARLTELESALEAAKRDEERLSRELNAAQFKVSLAEQRQKEATRKNEQFLAFFAGFRNDFLARIHDIEVAAYKPLVEGATKAAQDEALPIEQRIDTQLSFLELALDRIEEALGGRELEASASFGDAGEIRTGKIRLIGPWALFAEEGGDAIGFARKEINGSEPKVTTFRTPEDRDAAQKAVLAGEGFFPFDPTLSQAAKFLESDDGILAEIEKGGSIMYPIVGIGILALLVALWKWGSLIAVPRPKKRQVAALLQDISDGERDRAHLRAKKLRGPTGRMLEAGVLALGETRNFVEEIMYEHLLRARLKSQALLPFIAVTAASAPLLGLLGTVTGIIATFKVITVAGSSDVKSLSGGISEALITTKYGLIVAIPTLLLHAFLSRMAKTSVAHMESIGARFLNEAQRMGAIADAASADLAADPAVLRDQLESILGEVMPGKTAALTPQAAAAKTSRDSDPSEPEDDPLDRD